MANEKILLVEDDFALAMGTEYTLKTEHYEVVHASDLKTARKCLQPDIDLVQGLELGADDYIAKPYRVKELLTRISVILRRQRYNNIKKTDLENEAGEDFIFGHTRLDNKQYKIYRNERNIDSTPSEFRLLRELTLHENQVMTRRQLIERLWDVDESFVDDNTLSVYIKRLRDKLEEDSAYIRTVRGIGYMFVPDSANK